MKKIILVFLSVVIGMVALWQISKSRTFQFAGELISNVQATDSLVALTFDDGPTPEYTDEVLGILDQYGIRATFFVTGRETERFPEQAAQIVAAGHQLGNHSYSHPQMIFKSGDFILEELERTDVAIRKAGYQGTIYFRPPFGKKLLMLPWILQQESRVSITWDVEPESYPEVGSDARKIADHIEAEVSPGSIILLHVMYESREESRKSLSLFIKRLKKRGYKFVTITELLDARKTSGHPGS